MKYVPKEPPGAGLIADADAMMREFNRAMGVVHNDIDQNNVADKAISWQRIASPVARGTPSTSVLGDRLLTGHRLFMAVQSVFHTTILSPPTEQSSGAREERDEGHFWEFITGSANNDLVLEVPLQVATDVTVIGTGNIDVNNPGSGMRTSMFDIRLYNNGGSLGISETVSNQLSNGDLPFYVAVRKRFSPGKHTIKLQVRDRSQASTTGSGVKDCSIVLFGFCR